MIAGKLTTKTQTTKPQSIHAALHLKEGQELVHWIDGREVILTEAKAPKAADDLFRIFSEWKLAANRKANSRL